MAVVVVLDTLVAGFLRSRFFLFSFYSAVLECVVLVDYILSDVILVVTAVVLITPVLLL